MLDSNSIHATHILGAHIQSCFARGGGGVLCNKTEFPVMFASGLKKCKGKH